MRLTIPFPPSVNGYWRSVRGRNILSARGRQYRLDGLQTLAEQAVSPLPADARLSVTITLNPPCKRRRDVDNYSKAALDLLTHAGIWGDDSQVDRLTVQRGEIRKPGNAVVEVALISRPHQEECP